MVDQKARAREVKQLWAVARMYLEKASSLKSEKRTYRELDRLFEDLPSWKADLRTLRLSANLDSAAVRMSTLDERLEGGVEILWAQAYAKLKPRFLHVYLRDSIAHAEALPGQKKRWLQRQEYIRSIGIGKSYRELESILDHLRAKAISRFSTVHGLESWFKVDALRWSRTLAVESK